jgi:hypothetical protein
METKPAFYTTEFWITVLTQVGLVLAVMSDTLAPRYGAMAAGVSVAAYSIARGLAKQGQPADPTVPANYKLVPRRRDMRPRG